MSFYILHFTFVSEKKGVEPDSELTLLFASHAGRAALPGLLGLYKPDAQSDPADHLRREEAAGEGPTCLRHAHAHCCQCLVSA